MAADPAIVSAYGRAFARLGVTVQATFTRVTGVAPNTGTASATVSAVIRNYQPDTESVARTGYGANQRGAITEGDRDIIVMGSDLAAAGFPLPVKKNDRITVRDPETDAVIDVLNVIKADPLKRNAGGAIEITAAGVA